MLKDRYGSGVFRKQLLNVYTGHACYLVKSLVLTFFTAMSDYLQDAFDPVEDAIAAIAAGKIVIVTDD